MKICRLSLLLLLILFAAASPAAAETMVPLMVKAGSNLMSLANQYCHDREDWRRIAEVNKLRAPYTIREDTTLLVPAEILLSEDVSVTIGAVYGAAQLSLPGATPRPVASGDLVPLGATVKTDSNSSVLLIFPDQRFIRVDADSSLHVDLALRLVDGSLKIQTTLEQGSSLNNIKPREHTNDSFILRTPTALTGVRGTEYRLKVNEATQVETLRGEVYATSQSVTRTVPVGQGVIVRKKQAPGASRPLPPPPDDFVVAELYKNQPIRFRLSGKPGSSVYLTISRDQQRLHAVERRLGQAGETVSVTLPEDGRYFASLTAIDREGFESLPTPSKAFILRTSPPPILTIPQDARFFSPSASLSWSSLKDVANYHVMVAKDAGFTQPLHDVMVSTPSWNTPNLPNGTYYARVQSVASDGFRSDWSASAAFAIAEPLKNPDNKMTAGGSLHLHWNAAGNGALYDLQIAPQPDFNDPLVVADGLRQPEYTLEKPLKPGVYYLRVRSKLPNASTGSWGPAQEITIVSKSIMPGAVGVVLGILFLCIIL